MPKILFINTVCNGSTGTICKNLYKAAEKKGFECYIAFGRGKAPEGFNTIRIGKKIDIYSHVIKARLFDASGFGSKRATKEFIKEIEKFKPDIIHLHNIHGYYINIEILFNYLRKHPEIKKIWTLHDCWTFTGHCPHFEYEKCVQWKTECKICKRIKEYPKAFIDRCQRNFNIKRKILTDIKNMILITPSKWLMELVKQSFLFNYETKVINNGIDTNIFKHVESNIKKEYRIQDKKIILGVAFNWNMKKGLDIFIDLSKKVEDEYQIVLIGISEKQKKILPNNIIGINKTENRNELIEWYSAADVFINPTLEDNFPTVNLEAQACGTPVITFNTGGCSETVPKENIAYDNNLSIILELLKKELKITNKKYEKTEMEKKYLKEYIEKE